MENKERYHNATSIKCNPVGLEPTTYEHTRCKHRHDFCQLNYGRILKWGWAAASQNRQPLVTAP